jgi:hypothetical protein
MIWAYQTSKSISNAVLAAGSIGFIPLNPCLNFAVNVGKGSFA